MLRRKFGPIRPHHGVGGGGMRSGSGAELGRGNRAAGVRGDRVPRGVPNTAKLAWVPSRAPLPVRLLKLYVGIVMRPQCGERWVGVWNRRKHRFNPPKRKVPAPSNE
jgi:hypothetical protein